MKARIYFLLQYFLFWVLFFQLGRAAFLCYHHAKALQFAWADLARTMLYGLRMDMSMAGYLTLLPLLATTLALLWPSRPWLRKLLKGYHALMLLVGLLVVVSDMELYSYWGFRLDHTPLFYVLTAPAEALGQVPWKVWMLGGIAVTLLWAKLRRWTSRMLLEPVDLWEALPKYRALYVFALGALLFFPIRGSIGVAPMNVGFVYFHAQNFPNHAGINPLWNLLRSMGKSDRYTESYMPKEEVTKTMEALFAPAGIPKKLLRVERPNVLFIALESFTAKAIEPLGGVQGLTPELNKLAQEGVLFTQFYASGDRTDRAISAMLSAFPAQTTTSLIKYARKTETLPSVVHDLKAAGYKTLYVQGGDTNFANFHAYLTNAGFERIVDLEDFPREQETTKWGVHDGEMFPRALEEISAMPQPFFSMVFTLSSHDPFDVPERSAFYAEDYQGKFMNAIHYTDKHLGAFIAEARRQPWWDNTLIVLMADHGISAIGNLENHEPGKYHIPMIWLGGALKRGGIQVDMLGGQTDFAPTLLGQLGVKPQKPYPFGKNLLAEDSKSFAFYTFNNGYGFLTDSTRYVVDMGGKMTLLSEGKVEAPTAKSYMQAVFSAFNAL